MLMMLRIIFLLTIGLSSYGSTFAALPRLLEKDTASLSPWNNYETEFESRSLPLSHFSNKQKDTKTHKNALVSVNGRSLYDPKGRRCLPMVRFGEGKVIGDSCYIIGTTAVPFVEAQNSCKRLGGFLAQPIPKLSSNYKLYFDLKSVFPSEFRIIESTARENPKTLWIGYMQVDEDADGGDFTGQASEQCGDITVKSDSFIFPYFVMETTAQEGAAMTDRGFWGIFPITTRLPFVCQFPLI